MGDFTTILCAYHRHQGKTHGKLTKNSVSLHADTCLREKSWDKVGLELNNSNTQTHIHTHRDRVCANAKTVVKSWH